MLYGIAKYNFSVIFWFNQKFSGMKTSLVHNAHLYYSLYFPVQLLNKKIMSLDNQNNAKDDEKHGDQSYTETLALFNTTAEQAEILVRNAKLLDTFLQTFSILIIFIFDFLDDV